jgi:hypothetical protein
MLLLLCLFAIRARAQDPKAASVLHTDLPIADMSAFTLLHVNPYKIARPAGAKEFSAAILCIAKSDVSNAIPGIALEWAPYQTFDNNRLSRGSDKAFAAYKQSRILRNLQLSFAAAQDSFANRMAAGLSFVIFDNSDPSRHPGFATSMLTMMEAGIAGRSSQEAQMILQDDFRHERLDPFFQQMGLNPETDSLLYRLFNFQAAQLNSDSVRVVIGRRLGARLGFDRGFDTPKERAVNKLTDDYLQVLEKVITLRQQDPQVLKKLIEEERNKFARQHWNAGALKAGIGNVWYAPDFNWSHIQTNKFSSFVSWAFRVGPWGQGILFAQYTQTYTQDVKHRSSWVYGGRAVGGNYWIHGSIEAALHTRTYGRLFGRTRNDINTIRGTIGVEVRAARGLWAEAVIGLNGPYSDFAKNDGVWLAGSLKYTFKRVR